MNKEEFERFKEQNLIFFRKRYKVTTCRKELKRTIFENPNLNEIQKKIFWNLVTNKQLLNENEDNELKAIIKEI